MEAPRQLGYASPPQDSGGNILADRYAYSLAGQLHASVRKGVD